MENFKESGELIVICAWCGKKKEGEEWIKLEPEARAKIEKESKVSHGICPDCSEKTIKES